MDLLEIFRDSNDQEAYPAGAVIIEEGAEGGHMYVVLKGEVAISLRDREIATATAGEIVGEMALINAEIRSATVTAATDCVLAVIDETSFRSMLKHVPDFNLHVMNVLADRLKMAYEMIDGQEVR